MEKLKVVFAERGIYPYLKRIELKGNTFNDGCKTGTDVMNKDTLDSARSLEMPKCFKAQLRSKRELQLI